MSYHFIDKKDPHIDVMFQGLEKFGCCRCSRSNWHDDKKRGGAS